jgi:hypothetical protein
MLAVDVHCRALSGAVSAAKTERARVFSQPHSNRFFPMPTDLVDSDARVSELNPIESPETDVRTEALAQLEVKTCELEAAFVELKNLESQQTELEQALAQVCEDEKLIIGDSSVTEAQSVKKVGRMQGEKRYQSRALARSQKTRRQLP